MTIGFLLVLLGIKFHLVESYLLTPRATKFWNSRIGGGGGSNTPVQDGFNNSVNQLTNAARSGYDQTRNGFNAVGGFNGGNFNNNSYTPMSSNPYNPYSKGYMNNSQYGAPNNSLFQNASYQNPVAQNRNGFAPQAIASGYSNQMIGPQKQVTTPKWLGWPILFLGAVLILQGLAMRRD
jgi:hypothetical protein